MKCSNWSRNLNEWNQTKAYYEHYRTWTSIIVCPPPPRQGQRQTNVRLLCDLLYWSTIQFQAVWRPKERWRPTRHPTMMIRAIFEFCTDIRAVLHRRRESQSDETEKMWSWRRLRRLYYYFGTKVNEEGDGDDDELADWLDQEKWLDVRTLKSLPRKEVITISWIILVDNNVTDISTCGRGGVWYVETIYREFNLITKSTTP